MADLLVTGILLLIIGAAAVYIWKAKKRGVKRIGCPSAGKCSGKEGHTVCSCGCHSAEKQEISGKARTLEKVWAFYIKHRKWSEVCEKLPEK